MHLLLDHNKGYTQKWLAEKNTCTKRLEEIKCAEKKCQEKRRDEKRHVEKSRVEKGILYDRIDSKSVTS